MEKISNEILLECLEIAIDVQYYSLNAYPGYEPKYLYSDKSPSQRINSIFIKLDFVDWINLSFMDFMYIQFGNPLSSSRIDEFNFFSERRRELLREINLNYILSK